MSLRNSVYGFLAAILVLISSYATVSSSFAQTNVPPGMPGMTGVPTFEQKELTIDIGKAAIDSFLELKETYGAEDIPQMDVSPGAGAPQALAQYAGMQNIVKNFGFEDVGQWHLTMLSLFLAHNFQAEGKLEEYEQSLNQLKQANMPEAAKTQMLAMLNQFKPSENNLAVAAALNEDSEYGPKLIKIQD